MTSRVIETMGSWLMDAVAVASSFSRPGPQNPAFPCTFDDARDDLRRMAADPRPLARPVLVVGAYHAWAPVQWSLVRKLRRLTGAGDADIRSVSFPFETTLHAAAAKAAAHAIKYWGACSNGASVPLDLVGISMGGVISRLLTACDNAALGLPLDLPRIDARRIFTFGSPLSGARVALKIRPDRAARDMRPGSPLLQRLGAPRDDGPELICYAQLRDQIVGATRTAPPGMTPIWSSGTPIFSHFTTPHNPWFLADTARRLRGEEPLLQTAGAPPRD